MRSFGLKISDSGTRVRAQDSRLGWSEQQTGTLLRPKCEKQAGWARADKEMSGRLSCGHLMCSMARFLPPSQEVNA